MTTHVRGAMLLKGLAAAAFAALVGGVVVAQRTVGWGHLAVMLLCVSGLLALLWLYNRRYV